MKIVIGLGALISLISLAAMAWAAPAAEPTFRLTEKRQKEILYLLKQDCGSCHGMTLKGGLGTPLLPHNLQGKPDEFLVHTIREGRPGTAMPPWEQFLSEEETHWLVKALKQGVK